MINLNFATNRRGRLQRGIAMWAVPPEVRCGTGIGWMERTTAAVIGSEAPSYAREGVDTNRRRSENGPYRKYEPDLQRTDLSDRVFRALEIKYAKPFHAHRQGYHCARSG
jgi:hypothetical protein